MFAAQELTVDVSSGGTLKRMTRARTGSWRYELKNYILMLHLAAIEAGHCCRKAVPREQLRCTPLGIKMGINADRSRSGCRRRPGCNIVRDVQSKERTQQ